MRPEAPQRLILADSVYEIVREMIMDSRITPGTRISIDELSRRLAVSQTPVREALAGLAADGLVVKEPLRGYRAAPLLTPDGVGQLYELRLLIEPHAASRAATRCGKGDVIALGQTVEQMSRALVGVGMDRSYHQYGAFALEDGRFHDRIAALSGNRLLQEALLRLRPHLQLYRSVDFDAGAAKETLTEHEQIVEALRAGDGELARSAMTEHIQRSRERLLAAARRRVSFEGSAEHREETLAQ